MVLLVKLYLLFLVLIFQNQQFMIHFFPFNLNLNIVGGKFIRSVWIIERNLVALKFILDLAKAHRLFQTKSQKILFFGIFAFLYSFNYLFLFWCYLFNREWILSIESPLTLLSTGFPEFLFLLIEKKKNEKKNIL